MLTFENFFKNFTYERDEVEAKLMPFFESSGVSENIFISSLLVKDYIDKKEFFLNDIYLFTVNK